MNISMLSNQDVQEVLDLWNKERDKNRFLHKKLDLETFNSKFIEVSDNIEKINCVCKEEEKVIGFGNACYKKGEEVGYITFILVQEEYIRRGIGSEILKALEEELKKNDKLKKLEIIFFNPINLEWIVPGTKGHDHPNAPGVDMSSPAYLFFKNTGFRDFATQNSYYRLLEGFAYTEKIEKRAAELSDKEITITYYDKEKHYDFEELFENLNTPLWTEAIMGNISKEDAGYPVLIVENKGKICGFTGPLMVQDSKRGYFAGIGIHSEYRKHGAGKVLFSALCRGLKDEGAHYMTLFTGETNPARNIYESAGFKIVRSWADMRKEIK